MTIPAFIWLLAALATVAVGIHGLRGLLAIRQALHEAEVDRISPPPHWPATRALFGLLAGLPLAWLTRDVGVVALLLGAAAAAMGFWLAPHLLDSAKRRLQYRMLDELALHLDLLAVAMESGSSWSAALVLCVERTPDGPLRRAWQRVILDIHGGMEPLDALRVMEQALRLQPLATLMSALRAADKLKLPTAGVLRDRARHCSAARFARAERRARAAPLKLWAAMLLCLVPCTAVVLAYPLARLLIWVLA
ncbi:MAG TPA: type II secretion system F family protein [Steroidobacteraceae bacterium]|nr:type II secretion system F family protein [Steroidobacteraceae bacterium]